MNNTQLARAGIFTILLLIIALIFSFISNSSKQGNVENKPILSVEKESISKIEIMSGSNNLVITKNGSGWNINDFEADFQQVDTFVNTLLQTKIASTAALSADSHKNFDLTPDLAKTLKVFSGDNEVLNILIGKPSIGTANYFRFSNENTVYLTDNLLSTFMNTSVENLRNKRVVNIDVNKIDSVETNNLILKYENNSWVSTDGTTITQNKAIDFITDIANLTAVSITDGINLDSDTPIFTSKITYEDSKVLEYKIYNVGGEYIVRRDTTNFKISNVQFEFLNKKISDLI